MLTLETLIAHYESVYAAANTEVEGLKIHATWAKQEMKWLARIKENMDFMCAT